MDDENQKFQKKLARDQIILGATIAIGCTIFAVGIAFFTLSQAVSDNMISSEIVSDNLLFNQTTTNSLPENTTFNKLSTITHVLWISGAVFIALGVVIAWFHFGDK